MSIAVQRQRREQRVESVVQSLQVGLEDTVEVSLIEAAVEAEFDSFAEARVGDFVPIFVERHVRARLAQSQARRVERHCD